MELRLALHPGDLERFRGQAMLRPFKQGRPRVRSESGLQDGRAYRMTRSTYRLAGASWSAELILRNGAVDGVPVCLADIHPIEGAGAPLRALLQGLAEAVPFRVTRLDLPLLAPGALPGAVKARPPALIPEMSAADAFSAIAAGAFAHLCANHDCLILRDSAESIHQMRVALRRLRSAMSMFRGMLDGPDSEFLRGELRWLQQILGAARDWDVLLADTVAPLGETLGGLAGYERLCALIADRRQQARLAALAELGTPRLPRLMLHLAFWIESAAARHPLADRPVMDLARAILDKRHRRVRREMARFGELSVEERHQCRIDIKKLRYAVDFFATLYPAKRGQRVLPLLAALQDRLGALNDVAVARDKLEALVLQDGSAELGWAVGQLVGWHAGHSGRLLDQVRQDWAAVERLPAFWRDA
jgi:CHAD domain-containing protein